MKKFLLATVFVSFAGSAFAADYAARPAAYRAPPPPPPAYNWSGYYLGFNIGGQWSEVERTFHDNQGNFATDNSDGVFGFHAGVQYQFGFWVLGVEAALHAGFHEMRSVTGVLPTPLFTSNRVGEHKITNIFTVGPKLGMAFDRWMIYGTGGYATADLKGDYCVATTGVCGPTATNEAGASHNHGWFAGAGIDYMIHKGSLVDALLGFEYKHWDVEAKTAFCGNAACTAGNGYNLAASGDMFLARLTIKYNPFGYSAPVQARY